MSGRPIIMIKSRWHLQPIFSVGLVGCSQPFQTRQVDLVGLVGSIGRIVGWFEWSWRVVSLGSLSLMDVCVPAGVTRVVEFLSDCMTCQISADGLSVRGLRGSIFFKPKRDCEEPLVCLYSTAIGLGRL